MWSAAVDPRVLAVRAGPAVGDTVRTFDAATSSARLLRGPDIEHLLIDCGGALVRLDVFDGSVIGGPVALRFELGDDDHVETRIAALRLFRGTAAIGRHPRLAGRLLALQAVDAQDAGASLKETAELLQGPGDWPGDGDHRKSQVRRLLALGQDMKHGGARAILRMK
jgi:hypothetical protein